MTGINATPELRTSLPSTSNLHSRSWTLVAATLDWARKCMKTDINTWLTSTSPSQWSSKCKRCTRRRSQTSPSSRWMYAACNTMMALLMLSLTKVLSIQFYVGMALGQMQTRCYLRYTVCFPQQECTYASHMACRNNAWTISASLISIGTQFSTRSQSRQFLHLQ